MNILNKAFGVVTLLSITQIGFAATEVVLQTNKGDIEITLFDEQAPISSKNFKDYAKAGFYKGTIFHRVIPGFMIQGGGFKTDMLEKPTQKAIKNEANNGLKNERGTIAMARTSVVDSATSQFFINLNDNTSLNHGEQGYGYAVFGKVTKGMDIVDKIAKVPTSRSGMHQNVPIQAITILDVKLK